jgi:hypothetical protein
MSKLLKDNSAFLHLLMTKSTSREQIKTLLNTASTSQLNTLTEIAFNLLKGNIPISLPHKKNLKRYAKQLRLLSRPKNSLRSRKACLTPALVGTLLKAVAPVLNTVPKDAAGG